MTIFEAFMIVGSLFSIIIFVCAIVGYGEIERAIFGRESEEEGS